MRKEKAQNRAYEIGSKSNVNDSVRRTEKKALFTIKIGINNACGGSPQNEAT